METFSTGKDKLLFAMPIFENTENVLFVDMEHEDLQKKIVKLGIHVDVISILSEYRMSSNKNIINSDDLEAIIIGSIDAYFELRTKEYNIIILGKFPIEKEEKRMIFKAINWVHSESGYIVFVVSNKYSYLRILKRLKLKYLRSIFKNAINVEENKLPSLFQCLRTLKKAGFSILSILAPIPNIENPSIFIPLSKSYPLEFLISRFTNFSKKKSFLLEKFIALLIKGGLHKYFMNQYIVIANLRDKV